MFHITIEATWGAGVALVRVCDLDLNGPAGAAAVRHAASLCPCAPLLILTPGFTPIPGVVVKGQRDACAFLEDVTRRLQALTPTITKTTDNHQNTIYAPTV